jgi:hypothetical protein
LRDGRRLGKADSKFKIQNSRQDKIRDPQRLGINIDSKFKIQDKAKFDIQDDSRFKIQDSKRFKVPDTRDSKTVEIPAVGIRDDDAGFSLLNLEF